MAQLTIDLTGKRGLAPRYFGSYSGLFTEPAHVYLAEDGQMASGIYNPFTMYGYLYPANDNFETMGTTTSKMVASVLDTQNGDYYLAGGQKIYKLDTFDDVSLSQEHDLGATGSPQILDLEIYQLNGVQKLFYLYEKSDNLEIGEASLPISSENDNWLTADVSGSFTNGLNKAAAFMRVADNGFMYIFQDNNVHKVDGTPEGGTNGTVSPNVLQFPNFFFIKDAIDYRGSMYIAVYQTTRNSGPQTSNSVSIKCGVYVWDRFSSIVRTRDFIPVQGVQSIDKIFIAPDGSLRLLCTNSETFTEVRVFTGSSFKRLYELESGASPGESDGLLTVSNKTIWLGETGEIFAMGSILPGEKEGVFKIGSLGNIITFRGGALVFAGGDINNNNGLVVCYDDNTDNHVKNFDLYGLRNKGVSNSSANQGDIFTPVKYLPTLSTVNNVTIYFLRRNDTGSDIDEGTIKFYFNQSNTASFSKTVTRNDLRKGYKSIEVNKPFVNSIQLEIEYESNTILSNAIMMAPNIAVVEYESVPTIPK